MGCTNSKSTPVIEWSQYSRKNKNAEEETPLYNTIKEYQFELKAKTEELKVIFEIDAIRDKYPEPRLMFSSIVELLANKFGGTFCLLYVQEAEDSEMLDLWGNWPSTKDQLQDLESKQSSEVTDRISGSVLHQWFHQNYDSMTRTKEDAIIVCLRKQVPHPQLNLPYKYELYILGIQIAMEGKVIGILILAKNAPFTTLDVRILKAAECQIDSAIVQAHNFLELELRNRELEAIYTVDRLRDEDFPLNDFLAIVVKHLPAILKSDISFVFLYDVAEGKLKPQTVNDESLFQNYECLEALTQFATDSLQQSDVVWRNNISRQLFSAVMVVPLVLKGQIIGVFGAANIKNKKFLLADRKVLKAVATQMDSAIYDNLESFRLKQVLGRCVDGRVMERLLEEPNLDLLKPERAVATVLYADMRNSTHLTETTETSLLGNYINEWLGQMAQVVISFEGTLDKFIGDEVMALFNVPFPQPDHAMLAIKVAFAMQEVHANLMKKWQLKGVATTPIGIGIATGELLVGEMGCARRTDYTAIGRASNLGARLCANAAGSTVLISQETYDEVRDKVEAIQLSGLQMKGFPLDVCAYRVVRILG